MNINLSIQEKPVAEGENYKVIAFTGEFDKAGQSQVKDKLDEIVKSFDGKTLVFDFSALKFINSEGIGYLMEVNTHLMNVDKKLVIVGARSIVQDVFATIGINEIIPLFNDVKEFLQK